MRFNFVFDNAELLGGYGYESHAHGLAKKCEIGRWKSCCDTAHVRRYHQTPCSHTQPHGIVAEWPIGLTTREQAEAKNIEMIVSLLPALDSSAG